MPTLLQSLKWYKNDKDAAHPTLQVLDQLKLPHETTYIDIRNVAQAFSVIKKMQIRGAPLIAIVASLGLAVDLTSYPPTLRDLDQIVAVAAADRQGPGVLAYILGKMKYLETSRPTAVNLQNAMAELKDRLETLVKEEEKADRATLVQAVVDYATFMYQRDTNDNKAIGQHGAEAIFQGLSDSSNNNSNNNHNKDAPVTLMTICNTGSLATSHYGTALGIVRAVRDAGRLQQIVALETRPYNQGSRLTAYEMVVEQMPKATLICDSMAAAFLKLHKVDACVVGADRVCANGDTANKIGTYMLALVAKAHNVPFYVAAPLTTLDNSLPDGSHIPIEERAADELLQTSNAPTTVGVWNPAFDVTPAHLIAGIVTEKGVIRPTADGVFDCPAFCAQF